MKRGCGWTLTLIYKRTKSLRAVQLLLGHSKELSKNNLNNAG
jgi:hypothetical protein